MGKLAKFASKAKINAVFDNFLCKNGVASKDFAMWMTNEKKNIWLGIFFTRKVAKYGGELYSQVYIVIVKKNMQIQIQNTF